MALKGKTVKYHNAHVCNTLVAAAILCLFLVCAPAKAQEPILGINGFGIEKLKLSDAQKKQTADLVEKTADRLETVLRDRKTSVETKEKQVAEVKADTRKQFVNLLTPEQRRQYTEIAKATSAAPRKPNPAAIEEDENNFLSDKGGLGLSITQKARLRQYYEKTILPKLRSLSQDTSLTPDQKQQRYDLLRGGFRETVSRDPDPRSAAGT